MRNLAYSGLGKAARTKKNEDFAKVGAFSNSHGAIENLSFLSQ
jgi:hypothetical protein